MSPERSDELTAGATASRWGWARNLDRKQATHVIYLEIVLLAVLVALDGKRTSDTDIVTTVIGALVAVALAEVYAYYIGTMIALSRRPTRDELRSAAFAVAVALAATLPSIAMLLLGVLDVISLDKSFTAAKWIGVATLAAYSLLATSRTPLSPRLSILAGLGFGAIGLALVLFKQAFH